jgi:hypothetical protein
MTTDYARLRAQVLKCGDAYLTEYGRRKSLHVVPARAALPRTHVATCTFHSNPHFAAAARAGSEFAVFRTPSNNVLVVPVAPYTSILDFAARASDREFAALFDLAFSTRQSLERRTAQQWHLETIGHDVAHLHLRLVRHSHLT